MIPPEDAPALAQAIRTLVADPTRCEQLGLAGYMYAHANLDQPAALAQFEKQLLDLVKKLGSDPNF